MAFAIDGLISGLETTSLINSLMQLEAAPQNLLKRKVSTAQTYISALQTLNSKFADLATLAKTNAKPASLDLYRATSSSTSVTTTVSTGASAGEIDFVVDRLSQGQVTVSQAMTAWPDTAITITDAAGAETTITAVSSSLDDVVSAVNRADAAVTAMKVAAGTDPVTGDPLFRLQFTSVKTGEDGAFTLSGTSAAFTQIRDAQDAAITLWAGTSAAQTVTSSTNSFAGVVPGVEIRVSAVTTDPVTLTVARDDAAVSKVAETFVSAVNGVFAAISTKSVVTTTTGSDGNPTVNGGPFTGDSTVRELNQRLLSAATMPVNGYSPSSIGVSITKTGVLKFDADTFARALNENPARVETIMTELSARVAAAATVASDKYDGALTSKITGQESLVKNLSTQIAEWDNRLSARRSTLERTYAALEVQLGTMNSQSAWLSSQLGSLTTESGKK